MPENQQSAKNHAKVDPAFMFAGVVLLIGVGFAISDAVRLSHLGFRVAPLFSVLRAIALVVLALKVRGYATKNQDRIIRLEERLRLAALLPAAELARTGSLTTQQFIALRFASDAELPALVQRTLAENLAPKAIKEAVVTWRPDYQRV